MLLEQIKGYMEGRDITKIPMGYLAYPSKNAIVYKGTAFSRPGTVNDGTLPTGNTNKVVGEFVWKDALGGEKPIRALKDGSIQLKWANPDGDVIWITIGAVTAGIERVRFATWIDDNGDIIKKRVFFVDGTDKVYEWNGAVSTIASVSAGAHNITVSGTGTLEQRGFDPGDSSAVPVRVVRFSGGLVVGTDNYTTDSDMQSLVAHTVEAISNVPVAGDLIIGAIIEHDDVLADIDKDDIYCYKNKLALAAFDSIRVYFSDTEAKLVFTVPAPDDRVATSPFWVDLAGNYTAMISRYNQQTTETILWISDVDGWTKVTALVEQDAFDNWVKTDRVAETERIGALPCAVSDYKGDIIFFAQDRTIQRIMTLDVLAKDTLKLISDDVVGLLERVDVTEARIYYLSRYISIVLPAESMLIMLDMVEEHFLPPQEIGIGHISIIDGVQYGHSNVRDETFYLLSGRNDLGAKIQTVFAFPYYSGAGKDYDPFRARAHTIMGVSGRLTPSTIATVEQFYETDGFKAKETFDIDGSKIVCYDVPEDFSWATHVWGSASNGGGDEGANPLKRFFAYDKYNNVAWLEWRAVITVNGDEQEFHVLGLYIDDALANRKIPDNLFIPKV